MKTSCGRFFDGQALWQDLMCANEVLMNLLGVFKRPVRFNNSFGYIRSEHVHASIRQCLPVQKALTGRSWAMLKWPIQSNGFGHEKNDVDGHVLGIGGMQWAIG